MQRDGAVMAREKGEGGQVMHWLTFWRESRGLGANTDYLVWQTDGEYGLAIQEL